MKTAHGHGDGSHAGPPESDRRKLVALLAREWAFKGPPGIMDVSDIVAALPMAPSDVLAALKALFEEGLVDMDEQKKTAYLTPEGYEAAEEDGFTAA